MKTLDCLTVHISPLYSKKQGLKHLQVVTLKSKKYSYPAVLVIQKKIKTNWKILNNGCELSEIKDDFVFSPDINCLFAKHVEFAAVERSVHDESVTEKLNPKAHDGKSNISLAELHSPTELALFLKNELLNKSYVCLKTGMKLRLRYLTQSIVFKVVSIKSLYHHLPVESYPEICFKCFEGTQISVLEEAKPTELGHSRVLDFSSLGGYDEQIQDLKERLDGFLSGKNPPEGVLISGVTGVGKSLLGRILASTYKGKCITVQADDIASAYKGEAEAGLRKIFQEAQSKAPFVLYLDDVDRLCGSRSRSKGNVGVVNSLLHLIDGCAPRLRFVGVMVIGSASHPEQMDDALRRPGRLAHEYTLGLPTEEERLSILCSLLKGSGVFSRGALTSAAANTRGFVGADLARLLMEAQSLIDPQGRRTPETKSSTDPDQALSLARQIVRPFSLKSLPPPQHKVETSELFGLDVLRRELESVLRLFLERRELFSKAGITCPSRILLFGPSGCGKSALTRALARQFHLPVIPVRRSAIFGKYFGESEKNLGNLFKKAEECGPCVLHFETFDGVAGRRSRQAETASDVEGRVVNQLKVLLDGVATYDRVLVIAETNRPDILDADVIRRGRFHKYLHFSLPTVENRNSLINWVFAGSLSEDFLDSCANKTEGLSPAEVLSLKSEVDGLLEKEPHLTVYAALDAICESSLPSTSSKRLKKLAEFASIYCSDNLKNRPNAAEIT